MKNQLFLMIIFCLISHVAYSMSINLNEESKAKLIEQVKAENINRGYWPSDVVVRLEQFYEMPNERYFVRAVGSYDGYLKIEHNSGAAIFSHARLGRGTQGSFSKQELESFGVQLPEQESRIK